MKVSNGPFFLKMNDLDVHKPLSNSIMYASSVISDIVFISRYLGMYKILLLLVA